MLAALAIWLVGQGAAGAPQAPSLERVVPLELRATDPVLAGHGPSRLVEHTIDYSGMLHVWTKVEGNFDTFVRIDDPEHERVVEDDDSGGKPAAYVLLAVEPGMKLRITVAASTAGAAGKVELHLVASPETELTRAEAQHAAQELDLIASPGSAQDLEAARKRIEGLIDRIEHVAGGQDSEALARLMGAASERARELEQFRVAARATRVELENCLRKRPADHRTVQLVRAHHADNLVMTHDYSGARLLYTQALEVLDRTQPERDESKQAVQTNAAMLFANLGDLEGAVALQRRALLAYSGYLSEDVPGVQIARLNLAIFTSMQGDLQGARTLLDQGLAIAMRSPGGDESLVPSLQGELAVILHQLGDHQGARALGTQVLETFSLTLPDDARFLQLARSNLAVTLRILGEFKDASDLQKKAIEVVSATEGENSPTLQSMRTSLALTLHDLGDNAGSDALQKQALDFYEHTQPADSRDLALVRLQRAHAEHCHGTLETARMLAERALDVLTRTLPEGHPDIQEPRALLALILAREIVNTAPGQAGEGQKLAAARSRCLELLRARSAAQTAEARLAVLSSSPREAEERCARLSEELGILLAFAVGQAEFAPLRELDTDAFVLSETTRAAALGAAATQRLAAGLPEYSELRESLRRASRELAGLAQSGASPEDVRRAVAVREALERSLAQRAVAAHTAAPVGFEVAIQGLASRIAPDEALVGVRRYERVSLARERIASGRRPDADRALRAHLCAFVLRPGAKAGEGVLTRVELGPLAPIEEAVRAWRSAIGACADRGIAVTLDAAADPARQRGVALRELVFDPLLPALGGAKHMVITLDDVLHLVPLDALPAKPEPADARGSQPLLGERLRIDVRCTLAELLVPATPLSGPETLLALGGANFFAEPLALGQESAATPASSKAAQAPEKTPGLGAALLRGGAWERGFVPLTYGSEEARGIASVFKERGTAQVLEERHASRAALEALAPRARWLHVATHGWCAADSIKSWADIELLDKRGGLAVHTSGEQEVRGLAPMLLCGLALAGANLPEDVLGRPPGLLTAEELSTFDLSNCELAVLSACDTSVGQRRAGQGVASLQKALHMAGARSAITSLWKVPDQATKDLMLNFYQRTWFDKKPKSQALWEAKMWLRNQQDESGRPKYSTRDWAAWVLTGDPR